jgi:hypothetical protein
VLGDYNPISRSLSLARHIYPGDFDGDGILDVLFYSPSVGDTAFLRWTPWYPGPSTRKADANVGNIGANLNRIAVSDLNQDGVTDIFTQDTSGNVSSWLVSTGATLMSTISDAGLGRTTWAFIQY